MFLITFHPALSNNVILNVLLAMFSSLTVAEIMCVSMNLKDDGLLLMLINATSSYMILGALILMIVITGNLLTDQIVE